MLLLLTTVAICVTHRTLAPTLDLVTVANLC